MRGGAEEDGARLAVGAVDAQHGNGAVGQAARIDAEDDAVGRELAAIHDEIGHPAAPRQPGRFQLSPPLSRPPRRPCPEAAACIRRCACASPLRIVFGGRRQTSSSGPAWVWDELRRICSRFRPVFWRMRSQIGSATVRGKTEQIAGDKDGAMAVAVFQDQRLDVQVGGDFLKGLGAAGVARQLHRPFGRDLDLGQADLPFRLGGGTGAGDGEREPGQHNAGSVMADGVRPRVRDGAGMRVTSRSRNVNAVKIVWTTVVARCIVPI